jgi:6-phosphogluconate dehydrogenase
MQLGMVGLGRMGANLVRRLMRDGHECVVYDVNQDMVKQLESEGAVGASSLKDLAEKLTPPRAAWVMVPAGEITEKSVNGLAEVFEKGDTIIDGGNSYYRDDIRRSKHVAERGLTYLDCGTSGGTHGLERGYCLMIGGDRDAFDRLKPLFSTIAPGVKAAERTPGRTGEPSDAENGFMYCGESGAGHFVKMVHNGIEYGMMASYAEGLNILHKADIGDEHRDSDAETAPLEDPQYYRYDIDVAEVSEVWRRGSVVASWLLDLTAEALHDSPTLDSFSGRVSDSGEGRWTAQAAIEEGVPAPVLTAALFARFSSRGLDRFASQLLSAMRHGFGGHDEKPAEPAE